MIKYGLCNPVLDEEISALVVSEDETLTEEETLNEVNVVKKKLTHFNEKNEASKSTKKIKVK